MDELISDWAARIAAAAANGGRLRLHGGLSKAFMAQICNAEMLDVRPYRGIVSFEPSELVVTVRAGTPLAELEATLAEAGQMLAFEPPHLGAATVGGCVAAGLSGPARAAHGALRDYLLGVRMLDGRGQLLRFGGEVMKNVAGFDVARLMAGAWGSLGLLLDVSFKLLPRPRAQASIALELTGQAALDRLNRWAGQPWPITASVWQDGVLRLRLAGAEPAVRAAQRELGGEPIAEAEAARIWSDVREQRLPWFFNGEASLWRVAVPSTVPLASLPGTALVEWGGAQRWLRSHEPAQALRAQVARLGGHAIAHRDRPDGVWALDQPAAPLQALNRRLKHVFDPAGVFNPGLMYPEQ